MKNVIILGASGNIAKQVVDILITNLRRPGWLFYIN